MRWYDSLRRQAEIAFVRHRGRQVGLPTLVAFGVEERGRRSRITISVSTSIGGAVVRNLVRRRIRGALDAKPPGARPLRVLFVARPPAASEPYARLAADVETALDRLRGL